ncbi:SulP family inorganic anion transporter [Candidatus Synechococcus calcipolaris G9]|uniref:SulP family inorganic anion transporter n=1 Tax=Candidatus Synechococcus calcipolaris G9 TaxID=1497997 RepID=A0ABT6F079_9SYNE|nr:SulP family inorganic anion transporter [Candidatus Synechococcus calcipolaris]MDG2991270.1 SulP family inorganic anion transporter [Candidatus Synechococcus calcipolaris G9]
MNKIPVNRIQFWNWRGDLFGGLSAAIVALPLGLAFGVSSGAGAIAGLYGSIFVGFFAALFGGTPTQVSGPTGPMTVVITTVITALVARHPEHGLAMAFTVVMLGGLFQILMGFLRLGQYITLMPYTVISGFMSGIGIIIIVIQLPPLLGYGASGGVVTILETLPQYLSHPNLIAVVLGLLTLTIVAFTPPKINRLLPAPLMALILVTLISVVAFGQADLPRIGSIPVGLPQPKLPTFELSELKDMIRYGIMLGFLGAIDSLLTSLVSDSIAHTQHDSDKELIGQGIGNCVSGLMGGLPGAGATMRTVMNIQAGGRTPLAGIIHAVVLVAVVFLAGPPTSQIPHAVLAGLLLKVGLDIIDWSFIKRAPRLSLKGTGIMYLVLILTVFVDLIVAVIVGAFIANLLTIKRLTEIQSDRVQTITTSNQASHLSLAEQELFNRVPGEILLFQLGGPLSFGAAKTITKRMSILHDYRMLVLDLSDVPSIGVTATLAIEAMTKDALNHQRQVWVVVSPGAVKQRIAKLELETLAGVYFVESRLQALEAAVAKLDAPDKFDYFQSSGDQGNGRV